MQSSTRSSRSCLALLIASTVTGCTSLGALPDNAASPSLPWGPEQTAIEAREVCVGSAVASVGTLTDVLYYRATVTAPDKIYVGYFAFFSDERPWGNNWQTWTLFPALAIDLVYTRLLFVAPGLQRALSGKGDVEGFRIDYQLAADGSLSVERAEADDGSHRPVHLDAAEVMSLDPVRPTLYSDVWSHQLGGRGLRSRDDLAYVRCFGPGQVRPLPEAVATEFTLDGRALPAHVEALGGRSIATERRVTTLDIHRSHTR